MAPRFTYSRWDGSQRGFDLDADLLFDQLTDELLYHGDVNAALRRIMQEGMRGPDGERLDGLRDMMERLRQERQNRLEQSNLGGVYDEIADELDDIIDEERHAIENVMRDAEASGDERRSEAARNTAAERNMRLDLMPNDLAGKVRELSAYDFESVDAQRRFEQMIDKLRQQLMQQAVDQMSDGMQNMSPQDMQRMKDMLAALNDMLDKHQQGDDPGFEQFMEEFGDFFPENPQNVDELLEQMAKRMAAMQAMLNSMSPEQRSQLQQLSDQLMSDMDLQWQMDQLGSNLQQMFPQLNWGQSYDFEGQDPMGISQAMQAMADLGDLDQLEHLLQNATNPGALAEVDIDRVRDLLGDDAAKSLERLSQLTKMLEESGLIENKEGRLELTPRGLRAIGSNAPAGPVHETHQRACRPTSDPSARAGPRTYLSDQVVRIRRPVPTRPASHDPQRPQPHGTGNARAAAARRLRDRADRAPHQVIDGADARPVDVDAHARQLPAGQEGRHGAAPPDLVAVPSRLPRLGRVQRDGPGDHGRSNCRRCRGTSCTAPTCSTGSRWPASCSPSRAARSRSS